jgi:DNA recombination protein RmuC
MEPSVLYFAAGIVLGATAALALSSARWRTMEETVRGILDETERQGAAERDRLGGQMRDAFNALSREALSRNSGDFLGIAGETLARQTERGTRELEGKKELIDQALQQMREDLLRVRDLISTLERDREQKFGELSAQVQNTAEQARLLQETAEGLRSALTNTTARGQWGERMAEDVLRVSGLVEGVNYVKQKTQDATGRRPDYTFFLPGDRKVHMDVKFPLDNYMRFMEAEGEGDRERFLVQFLRDVRTRIRDAAGRDYIHPEAGDVDYLIVFIPNERVFAFIHENDRSLMDEALRQRVVLCSPFTLYAVLSVIRQAVENFSLEKTATEILTVFSLFYRQWRHFAGTMERMGKKIEEARSEYESLVTSRKARLDRSLLRIEELRREKGVPAAEAEEDPLPEGPGGPEEIQ